MEYAFELFFCSSKATIILCTNFDITPAPRVKIFLDGGLIGDRATGCITQWRASNLFSYVLVAISAANRRTSPAPYNVGMSGSKGTNYECKHQP